VLVGDDDSGIDRRYRDAVVAAEGIEHYHGLGDPAGLMRHLDLLVLPAHQASAEAVLLEAMAAGKPVVATRVGGMHELIQDGVTGLLAAPGDPDGLASAVLRVLERRGDMGAAAARSVRRFHTPRYVDTVEHLISSD
jgi:glycosyltransferase involved in cell wall biosynthesis